MVKLKDIPEQDIPAKKPYAIKLDAETDHGIKKLKEIHGTEKVTAWLRRLLKAAVAEELPENKTA